MNAVVGVILILCGNAIFFVKGPKTKKIQNIQN